MQTIAEHIANFTGGKTKFCGEVTQHIVHKPPIPFFTFVGYPTKRLRKPSTKPNMTQRVMAKLRSKLL